MSRPHTACSQATTGGSAVRTDTPRKAILAMKKTNCLASLTILLSAMAPLCAQTSGAIVGRVTDASGAIVPHVTVEVTNQDTGVTASTATNVQGEYLFARV